MPPKKGKSHVFPTKSPKKNGKAGKATSQRASLEEASLKPTATIEQYLNEPPKKKARTQPLTTPKKAIGLMDLPPEIRVMIYGHVLTTHTRVLNVHRGSMLKRGPGARVIKKRGVKKTHFLVTCCAKTVYETTYVAHNGGCPAHQGTEWALMWVCSLMRREVTPMTFEALFVNAHGIDALVHFLKDLTPDQRASIRNINAENCCNEILNPDTRNSWTANCRYLAVNLQLKRLMVEARCETVDFCEDTIWVNGDPNFEWLNQLCKMRNLEYVSVEIKVHEPEIGRDRWEDHMEDMASEFGDDEEFPDYDSSWDWTWMVELSDDISWQVAREVLSTDAWERRKKQLPLEYKRVRENRHCEMERLMQIDEDLLVDFPCFCSDDNHSEPEHMCIVEGDC